VWFYQRLQVKVLLPESFAAHFLSAVCPFGVYRLVVVDLSLAPDQFVKLKSRSDAAYKSRKIF
jgi:hypothetical protein